MAGAFMRVAGDMSDRTPCTPPAPWKGIEDIEGKVEIRGGAKHGHRVSEKNGRVTCGAWMMHSPGRSVLILTHGMVLRMSAFRVPPQPIDATQALNLSAGVSNSSVLRGRSFSCRATLFR